MKTASVLGILSGLRPYQREAATAILDSVLAQKGLSFSVEISRQGGKNELSARLELVILALHADRPLTAIKAAPTLKPQALISLERLRQRAGDYGLQATRENGNSLRLGRARQLFLSAEANSNVVGHTADLLLEVDEAQDVAIEKYDKELRPMAADSGATTVFYGTAWDDANLLERSKQTHLELSRADAFRRHFEFDWQVVGAFNPRYRAFVEQERLRLGADHPIFQTQFCLRALAGEGRLLGPRQLSLLRGSHAALTAPIAGETYVAGLDVAGEAVAAEQAALHDATVLSIGRVIEAGSDGLDSGPAIEVVAQYAWTGEAHGRLHGALVSLLRETWRVRRLAIDATGIGEPIASHLARALGSGHVERVKLSAERKSGLGIDLLAAINGGRLRLPSTAPNGETAECWRQLERCKAVLRANRSLNFYVEARDGHDDHVISLALLVAAASGSTPRRARGRAAAEWDSAGA